MHLHHSIENAECHKYHDAVLHSHVAVCMQCAFQHAFVWPKYQHILVNRMHLEQLILEQFNVSSGVNCTIHHLLQLTDALLLGIYVLHAAMLSLFILTV